VPGPPPAVLAVLGLVVGLSGCGSRSRDIDGACLRLSQASSILAIAQGAIAGRTATASGTLMFYGDLEDDLADAAVLLPAGPTRDQVSSAAAAMRRAEASVRRGATDPAAVAAVQAGITASGPVCFGHLQ